MFIKSVNVWTNYQHKTQRKYPNLKRWRTSVESAGENQIGRTQ